MEMSADRSDRYDQVVAELEMLRARLVSCTCGALGSDKGKGRADKGKGISSLLLGLLGVLTKCQVVP